MIEPLPLAPRTASCWQSPSATLAFYSGAFELLSSTSCLQAVAISGVHVLLIMFRGYDQQSLYNFLVPCSFLPFRGCEGHVVVCHRRRGNWNYRFLLGQARRAHGRLDPFATSEGKCPTHVASVRSFTEASAPCPVDLSPAFPLQFPGAEGTLSPPTTGIGLGKKSFCMSSRDPQVH